MKRIIILLFVTLSLAAISAPADSVQKTVTLTQEQLDQLLQDAAEADQYKYIVQEATDQLRSEMESRYNTYVTHVGWIVALFSVLAGIIVPLMINKDYKKDIELKISLLESRLKKVGKSVIAAQESAQKADEAKVYTETTAQAIPYFYQALIEKDLNKKIELNTKAIELAPRWAEAYINRGSAYAILGNFDEAIKDYTRAIKLNPNIAYAYDNRALCYIKLAEKETDNGKAKEYYQKALNDCNTGLSLNPDEEFRKALEANKQLCEEKLKNL